MGLVRPSGGVWGVVPDMMVDYMNSFMSEENKMIKSEIETRFEVDGREDW